MMCQACKTEMFIHKVAFKDGKKEVTYRCPNRKCPNFGYKNTVKKAED